MIKAAILIGGKSERMGEDKYLMQIEGMPQYQRLFEMISSLDIPVFLSCTEKQAQDIPDEFAKIIDLYDGIGPIGGITSVIKSDPAASWLIVACDMIGLTQEAIKSLIEAQDDNYDVVTYQNKGASFFETTLSIYNPGAYVILRREVRAKMYSMQNALRKCTVKTLEVQNPEFLKNANTPEDLAS